MQGAADRLETERIWLRPFTFAGLHALASINSDPEVMCYTGNGELVLRAETESRLHPPA